MMMEKISSQPREKKKRNGAWSRRKNSLEHLHGRNTSATWIGGSPSKKYFLGGGTSSWELLLVVVGEVGRRRVHDLSEKVELIEGQGVIF